MRQMTVRGLKIFFKDAGGVLFSLLGVIVIFCLFLFFIGDTVTQGLDFLSHAGQIMDAWVVSGMLASCAITTSMGAYAVMVSDREQKCVKDFYASPLKRSGIAGGYLCTGFLVSVAMSLLTLLFGQVYIVARGGTWISPATLLQVLGVILLSCFASSAMVCFLISFLKTGGAYTTASILLGTLIGFLVGAYISVGALPAGVQWVIKCFPCAHAAVLFRQLLMGPGLQVDFAQLPEQALQEFEEQVGVTFRYGQYEAAWWVHALVLLATGVVFYLLAILKMSRRLRQY
ncbi:MAG TPA: ABC transporter permease [Candidatus Enterenecus merdae]|nr:ABC transporter permease [Candidatus Enterenecus merdae]